MFFSFTDFNSIFLAVLNKHAPIKKGLVLGLFKTFMGKEPN